MIKRVLSIAIAASLLSSCAVLTVKDVGGEIFMYKELFNGAITRAKSFCDGQGKSFLRKKLSRSIIEGRSPSVLLNACNFGPVSINDLKIFL